ncbi:hypothetical protein ACFPYI_02000 [Halomarina salina]|uniref:DUF1059 domain-containing protein n=1 Tax=Halomarina salina TaxID=1872699 RepID=A0ABD5RIG4_9EURY|nr:hypothetical protein [Halomarina salina]
MAFRITCPTCGFEGETHNREVAESLREMHLGRAPDHPVEIEPTRTTVEPVSDE